MLAKVPIKRLDGKSSFVALTDYIIKEASAVRHSDEVFSAESAGTDMALVASMNERAPRFWVNQLGRGSDPVMVVGSLMSLVTRSMPGRLS